jgi:hypothetical protein
MVWRGKLAEATARPGTLLAGIFVCNWEPSRFQGYAFPMHEPAPLQGAAVDPYPSTTAITHTRALRRVN